MPKHFVFEVDIAESESPSTIETFVRAALPDSPDEAIYNALDDDTYRLAEATATELGLPFADLIALNPGLFMSISLFLSSYS